MSAARKLFGTDGIRGPANVWPMTVDVAARLGQALAHMIRLGKLGRGGGNAAHQGRVVLGKDTRLSGYMIEQALAAGITSGGVDVMLVGPLPTPGIAFITHSMRADAGVVVSASHNSFEDNGMKIFDQEGFKLPDAVEAEMEALVLGEDVKSRPENLPTGDGIGKAFRIDDARGRYIVDLKRTFPRELTLDGLIVVVDCAHGAAYRTAPEVMRELGAEVIALGVSPDGSNINAGVGSLHPQGVQAAVKTHGAHLGICLDGDADRVIVVDETGASVDGDAVMALCARELHRRGELKKQTLVSTVMSNVGLERCLKPVGVAVERVQVGDRYVVERMRQGAFNLGGEQSGHLIFLDHATTGDGMVAALSVLSVMVREQKKLSELAGFFVPSPQELISVKVQRKIPLENLGAVQRVIDDVEAGLGGEGRVLVRYSGTEMKARVMVEGSDATHIAHGARRIADALVQTLNAVES